MKNKILKIFVTILLIMTLTMTNFVFLGYEVLAAYEELESQNIVTNVRNVEFDAYFVNGEQRAHSKESDLDNKETLVLNVNVKDKGSLNDAKIKLENTNFTILKDEVNSQYVKSINTDTNEIELNQIIYQNNAQINIPITFKKQDNFDDDYFEKENTITISGNYSEEEGKNEEVSSSIKTRMIWKTTTDVSLSQSVDKYINLNNEVLLQQNIVTSVQDNKLPRENETLEVNVPVLDEQKPTTVRVLLNGDKMSDDKVVYNSETGTVQINNDTKNTWGSQNNTYKVIYEYENVEFTNKVVSLNTTMTSKLYTQDNVTKADNQNIEITPVGNVVSIEKKATESKYKGYLYANSSNLTEYDEVEEVEISNESEVSNIDISENQEIFLDGNGATYDITSKTVYLQTMFNKENIVNLLGEDGQITITDSNNTVLSVVNSQSIANEIGNIVVDYSTPVRGLKISTTKPINVGTLLMRNKKGIEGNTGYSKEQLKQFTTLSSSSRVTTNISDVTGESRTNLLDTTTEARLEVNNTNLSTLQTNENVQFTVTLKTASEQYDLFKNPVIEITLPSSVSNVNVKSINKVYADEFSVQYARLANKDNGEKAIQIALSGEQSDYSKEVNELSLVINTDIDFSILTPNQKSSFNMIYTNENGNEASYSTAVEFNITSKPGMMIYNSIAGYNNAGESLYTIDNNVPVGVLDLNSNSNTATINTAVINNYETDLNDVVIIGRLPRKGTYNATLDTSLVGGVNTNVAGAQILYSTNVAATQNDGFWTEDPTNAASYMITLGSMSVGQVVTIGYQVTTPENIGYGQSLYAQTETTYTYLGNTSTQTSTIGAKSEDVITNNILALANTVSREANGVDVAISTVSGGSELEDGSSVYEGQKIRYTMQITNNTGRDLSNVNIKATQTNGNIYGLVEVQAYNPNTPNSTQTYHEYDELDTNENTFDTISTLANGESTVVSYEITVSEVDGEGQQTYGDIVVTADDMEDINITTIKSNINQAELKLTMESAFYEDEEIYFGRNIHTILSIQNISGGTLNNVKGTIKLPDGVYCEDENDLIWSSIIVDGELKENPENNLTNVSYDEGANTVTFELSSTEANEITTLGLYVNLNEFDESSKDFSFMYEMQGEENTYVSNMATLTVNNTKRNVSIEQTASVDENTKLKDEDTFDITINVTNNDQEELLFIVGDNIPQGFSPKSAKLVYSGSEEEIPINPGENTVELEAYISNNTLNVRKTLASNQSMQIVITFEVEMENITEYTITNEATVTYGKAASEDKNYIYEWSNGASSSKDYQIQSREEAAIWVEVAQTGSPETNSEVQDGQEVRYTFTIRNLKDFEIVTSLYDYIPRGVVVDSVTLGGEAQEVDGDVIINGCRIPAGGTVELEIVGHISASDVRNNQIVNALMVSTNSGDVTSNDVVYTLAGAEDPDEPDNPDPDEPDDPDPDEPDNPDNPDPDNPDNPNPDNPGTDNPSGDGEYTISGTAWLDSNKDGRKDSSETTLSGIGVRVLDATTGSYVSGIDATTNTNGNYEINVDSGNYILVFTYDTDRYILTDYKKAGIDESQNSDVISKTLTIEGTNSTVGATDTLNVSADTTNIDIGLVEASTFDLELDKYVSEVTVQTRNGTTQYSYGDQSLARVEIHSREINGATVVITYRIKITNTGEVPGYVQNIIDYIPSDLSFSSELNKDWYQSSNNLQNNSLSNTAIAPGEEKTVELVLVKNMTDDNTGTVINISEIGQASNTMGLSDIDSTPGNNNASEDDYGRAEIIIGVATGRVVIMVSIIFGILAIVGAGVFIINKKVLKKDDLEI